MFHDKFYKRVIGNVFLKFTKGSLAGPKSRVQTSQKVSSVWEYFNTICVMPTIVLANYQISIPIAVKLVYCIYNIHITRSYHPAFCFRQFLHLPHLHNSWIEKGNTTEIVSVRVSYWLDLNHFSSMLEPPSLLRVLWRVIWGFCIFFHGIRANIPM